MNVLKAPFNTRYETAPFSKIRNIDFIPAFEKAIAEAKKSIDIISSNQSSPNFENTIEALEFSSLFLEQISSIFFNLNAAETNDKIQKIAQEISPKLTSFSNDITLNENLFFRIRKIYESNSKSELTTEQKTLLEKKYKSFLRNGANLNSSEKINLRDIDNKLSVLSLKFGENLLAETNRFRLHVTNKNDLDGLPEFAVNAGKILAEKENKRGWLFSLDYPSYIPFITYIKNRELRKKMVLAFGKRGFCCDEFDNQEIILNIVELRHKRANLLGYKTHVDYMLEERMAKSSKNVITFLNKLKTKALKKAKYEFLELSAFAKKIDGIDKLEKWDNSYYSEKLKKEKFDIDDTTLKPYFKLENVLDGVFKIAEKLFEIQFTKSTEIDTYHKDVSSYKVINKVGDLVAIFYTDFFPRPGKRNGAWMTSFKPQYKKKSSTRINCL
jgi:peptidyl-dipeptidase Dcp